MVFDLGLAMICRGFEKVEWGSPLRNFWKIGLVLLAASMSGLIAQIAWADEEALYEEPLPDDAAFLRFAGFGEQEGTSLLGLDFGADRVASQNYSVVRASEVDGIEAGQYLTVLQSSSGYVAVEEPTRDERKVILGLINLTGHDGLSLQTSDQAATIVADIASSSAGFRAVNPIVVSVQVFQGDTAMGEVFDLTLRRDEHPTFIAWANGDVSQVTSTVIRPPLQ